MEEKQVNREEEMKKFESQVKDLEALDTMESEVINNTIEFEITKGEGRTHRVRMPTIREKMEINSKRLTEKRKLENAKFLYEAELIPELLVKQGVDIKKLNKEILDLNIEIEKMQVKLVPEPNLEHRAKLKGIIVELQNERMFKIAQKSQYLETSIEAQLTEIMITHYASLIFEKKVGDNWEQVFKSYDEYIDSKDDRLVAIAVNYTFTLLF